jgi:dihydroorotate dehydrogenase electron transfer subunit
VRSCTEGPVFDGASVRWNDVGKLPKDIYGAAGMSGH